MALQARSAATGALVAFVTLTATASGTTFWITPDGTGDYATIQEAISAAADGDTIELEDGTFRGDGNRLIDFAGLSITLRSRSGDPGACVIDVEGGPEDLGFGFVFQSGETSATRVEGIGVTGGFDVGC